MRAMAPPPPLASALRPAVDRQMTAMLRFCCSRSARDAETVDKHAPEAAAALKLTARDLYDLKLIDGIIPEPLGGAHQDHTAAIANLRKAVLAEIDALSKIPTDELLAQRYEKFRRVGEFAGAV